MDSRPATQHSLGSDGRPKSKGDAEKSIWSTMLDSVASGKRMTESNLIVLGGSPESQKEFLELLNQDAPKKAQDRHKKKPPIANHFGLGYTYLDVLDADHEDILARLSIYLLTDPSPSYAPLIEPLLTPEAIPNTLLIILLDWNQPWLWIRQLRDWVHLMQLASRSTSQEAKDAMALVMKDWQEKKRGPSLNDAAGQSGGPESSVMLPLSQGEWDEALGLPLCVVGLNSNKMNDFEIEQNWREDDFDFVLQFLRTILMKHGASLIYTNPSSPNSLPTLIHASLGIQSTLKKDAVKHNIIDREKVLVPPNWDSWGKIRVLREGFDVEGVSRGWSLDVEALPSLKHTTNGTADDDHKATRPAPAELAPPVEGSILPLYESTIRNPSATKDTTSRSESQIAVSVPNMQNFLTTQQDTLARLAAEDEKSSESSTTTASTTTNTTTTSSNTVLSEHMGPTPIQVNMGGISVDADDMVRKLQAQSSRSKGDTATAGAAPSTASATNTPSRAGASTAKDSGSMSTPEMKAQNEKLQDFFSGLMKRGANNSPRGTPGGTPSRLGRGGGAAGTDSKDGDNAK